MLEETRELSDIETTEAMADLVRKVVKMLVDESEAVEVSVNTIDGCSCLQVRVAPLDVGKVVGKQGRTARSLRTIVGAASMKLRHRFSLEIVEVR